MDDLSPEERIRFHFWMVVALRRFEAIYVQGNYGSIDQIRIEGFERFILTLISFGGPAEWWNSLKTGFGSNFVKYANKKLSTDSYQKPIHPGLYNE